MNANKKTWYTIKDGKIDRVSITHGERPLPEEEDWRVAPNNAVLTPETELARYEEETMRYLTDEEWLEKQGKPDPRGRWHHKDRAKQDITIFSVDSEPPGEEWTQEPPLPNEPYQYFDEASERWEVDEEKKELAEKEAELGRMKAEIREAEEKQFRSFKAIQLGTATEEDTEIFDRYEETIRELRPQVTALETAIKEEKTLKQSA